MKIPLLYFVNNTLLLQNNNVQSKNTKKCDKSG
jgi:hypothetical protein